MKLFHLDVPHQLTWWERLWWRFIPGETVRVRWPRGWVVLHEDTDGSKVATESADPNDHYRPWLEQNVGRQGWDWQWGMGDRDATENRLTIRIRRPLNHWCSIIALRWN